MNYKRERNDNTEIDPHGAFKKIFSHPMIWLAVVLPLLALAGFISHSIG